jgi:hypothetical protein
LRVASTVRVTRGHGKKKEEEEEEEEKLFHFF